jgi:allantoin racemase
MRLKVIVPVVLNRDVFTDESILAGYRSASRTDVEIDIVSQEHGPASIESEYEEALAQPGVIEKIQEAEAQGYDACLIDCFGDPGLRAAREVVSIPVIGAGEAAMFLAAMLGRRFSVITVLNSIVPLIQNNVVIYGLGTKLASVRAVDIPVLKLRDQRDALVERLGQEGSLAVEKEGANTIVLGCTGMAGLSEAVEENLRSRGQEVPVVDPVKAAVKLAESLIDLGLGRTHLHPE